MSGLKVCPYPVWIAAVLAGLVSPPSRAAESEDLYFGRLPVVATVSRLPQAQAEAPGSVTVIDREMIRASGARNLSDLLRLVPGFQVTPANTDVPRVAYHGLSNEDYSPRVQVLLDGRSQYSSLFAGGVNWNTLPVALEDIARIEVVRGSNSAAYGSNAFLGVVNIITLDASQARGGVLEVNQGAQGVKDRFVRWGGRLGAADVRLSIKEQADEGYFFRSKNPGDPSDVADGFKQRQFDFRTDMALTDQDQLQFSVGGLENRLDTGRTNTPLEPPRNLDQSSGYVHAEWRRSLDRNEEVGLRYFHSEESVGDKYHAVYAGLPFSFDRSGHSSRDDLEFQHILAPAETMRLVWGAEGRRDSVRNKSLYYSREEVGSTVFRLFGNLEWRMAQEWLAHLGGNWENNSLGGTTLAPRVNLSYQPTAGQTVRTGFSRAFRTPSAYELYGDLRLVPAPPNPLSLFDRKYLAVPGVRPEQVDSVDAGYVGEFRQYRASLDVRAFHERIEDRIVSVARVLAGPNCERNPFDPGCGHADYAVNGQRVTNRGIEYQLRWQPLEATRLMVNQAFVRISQSQNAFATSDSEAVRKIEQLALASAPHRSTTAMIMQDLPYGIQFSAIHHWVGEMRWTANSPLPAYRRLDLRLGYPLHMGVLRGEVAVVSQSANGEHAEFKDSRIVKERHWLTLRFEL